MADERAERCDRCRFWETIKGCLRPTSSAGICRRHAPIAVPVSGDDVDDPEFPVWPKTRPGDFCGEFQPQPSP